uniref:CSON006622 protein n=1 Tax=Culicoides sonorensis TaxID=179676 RepID=A0A336L9Q2_CULSO
MLKLPKGLKKKKKGKKKKDQELFTEEELEQYKQEQARKAAEAAEATAAVEKEATEGSSEPTDVEEWKKFAALTTGVDSILKKTQDDLDRIKTTSFFQRVAPKVEEPKDAEPEEDEETKKERMMEALKNAVVELSESEYESDDDIDVFNADYMEKVELPEGIIPDSPEIEEPEGDDPFDTGYAEKVIKGPEVSKSGKKIVNIGAAALVLTGAVDNVPKSTLIKRPKRRGLKNLLLSSFDAENEDPDEEQEEKPEPKNNQLDSLFELGPDEMENVEIDLSVSLHVKYKETKEDEDHANDEVENKVENGLDAIKDLDPLNEDDDEFAQLAAESLHKPVEVIKVVEAIPQLEPKPPESTDWAEFEQTDDQIPGIETELDLEIPVDDDDPFNTEFVEAFIPKVDSFEELARESLQKPTKQVTIEEPSEINLFEDNPSISITDSNQDRDALSRRKSSLSLRIDPSKNVQFSVPTPDPMKTDIEFSTLIKKPLTPYYPKEDSVEDPEENIDPFDTSFVPNVQPSQLELNYIEKEILKNLDEDDDFDPRAVTPEPTPVITAPIVPAQEDSEPPKTEDVVDPFGNELFEDDKYSALAVMDTSNKPITETESDQLDILTTSLAEASVDVKVLTPQMNPTDSFEMADIDPFDTTFAENIRPGEAELKLIESELIQ